MSLKTNPPAYAKNAKPSPEGWRHPKTNELLVAIKLDMYLFNKPAKKAPPAPTAPEKAVEEVAEPETTETTEAEVAEVSEPDTTKKTRARK